MAGWSVDIFIYKNIPVVLPHVDAQCATKYQAYKQKKRIDTRLYINTCIARYIKQLFDIILYIKMKMMYAKGKAHHLRLKVSLKLSIGFKTRRLHTSINAYSLQP